MSARATDRIPGRVRHVPARPVGGEKIIYLPSETRHKQKKKEKICAHYAMSEYDDEEGGKKNTNLYM